jgi:hypothetical protein
MRGALFAVLVFVSGAAASAAPVPAAEDARLERVGLRSIAGWLKTHGAEGYLAADVAQALGIGRGEATLDARQRGFRSAGTLRVAQLLADDSVLFMVQAADGEVYFYHSTLRGGLRRALLSIPGRGAVLPLRGAQAEANFRSEVLYWEDKAAND